MYIDRQIDRYVKMLIIPQSSAGDQTLVQSKKHTWNTENDLFKYCIYVYMHLRMKTHITYVYTDTCMSTSINTGAPQCRNRVAEIPGSMEVSITSSKSPSDHVYIYMSLYVHLSPQSNAGGLTLAVPETQCRNPGTGFVQSKGLTYIFYICVFMHLSKDNLIVFIL